MTARRPKILLVTTKVDVTADYVVLALEKRAADFYRLNTEDLPEAVKSSFEISKDSAAWRWNCFEDEVELSDVRAVWFRRHRLPLLDAALDSGVRDFCLRECDWFLRGALLASNVRWMSFPPAVAAAEAKLFQLMVARDIGFTVPQTVFTNDGSKALAFAEACGFLIAKSIRVGYIDDGAHGLEIFSNLITAKDLREQEESIRLAPVIFQEFIDKAFDVRVTVVADQIFAARIESQVVESARIDWRRSDTDTLPHARMELPSDLALRCVDLVRRLGLEFGAIDFVVDRAERYYFLEINPNGQWAWLQDRLGFDIAGAIADWLLDAVEMSGGK